jgi:flagellar protein FlaG
MWRGGRMIPLPSLLFSYESSEKLLFALLISGLFQKSSHNGESEMEIPTIKETPIRSRSVLHDPSQKVPKKPPRNKEVEFVHRDSIEKVADGQEETLKQLAENLNQYMRDIDYSLQFTPDRKSGIVIIKVLDGNGNVIRQIPPEAIQFLSSRMGESIGILLNSKL